MTELTAADVAPTAPVPPRRGAQRVISRSPRPRRRWPRRERWALAGLLTLAAVPVLAGAMRMTELAGGPEITEANARFVTSPVPVVVHVVSATTYLVLGAFQMAPTYRRRHLRRHRLTGRVLAPAGVLTALSGLWMAFAYDIPAPSGAALAWVRAVVGVTMVAFLVLGVRDVVRGDVARHRAWMIRAYALAAGAGTQVLTNIPLAVLTPTPTEAQLTTAMTAGWVLNAAVAEVVIRRGGRRRHRSARRPAVTA
ncbi:DUF2306 domain-containing protein [Cellulomonas carbonis]|uniref:Membrane protein n=1 Tax=Cellulomonas carbonis T26 TaxID=947969 RepID=A0A0A0BLK0_9CELL|nr:DUF2306 domain-containing protein [Cellulomonas carbonis]KGM08831.1 membrane protein [Cellulomonas carbonis T26]GGC18385.1 membrane protein [Cellulomonas carbonis]